MAFNAFVALFLSLSPTPASGTEWDGASRQAIVVITPHWESPEGILATFESQKGQWRPAGPTIPITVGHKGLGWGVGLHRERSDEPQKREGDKRAPAGVFRLEFGFGAAAFREKTFPFRQVSENDRWVDDPASRFYNQWTVLNDSRFPKDWNSAETMKRTDGIYDYVIVVSHNRQPTIPGRGSAVFIHSWFGPGKSTIGCTAMAKPEVKLLLGWLDLEAKPLLIQIPEDELGALVIPSSLKETIRKSMLEES